MKGLYRLINIEFAKWLVFITVLCVAAVILQLIALGGSLKNVNEFTVNARFEDLYMSSGCAIWFLVFLALACAYFLVTFYADYWGSKSVYTYLTLPVKREALYLSKLIVFATCMLLLLAAQFIGIRLGYALYENKVASYGDGMFVMHNGYFLAMIRSDFFRLLLPLNFSRILSTFGLFVAIVTGIYYAALCERSRKFYGFAAVIAAAWIAISIVGYRMNEKLHYMEPKSLYASSALLLVLSGFFIWHGLRIVRRGAIA